MPCDDCSRTEKCPPCPHEEGVTCAVLHQDTQGNTIPCPDRKPQGSEVSSSRAVPLATPCTCTHTLNFHWLGGRCRHCTVHGCQCRDFAEQPKPCTCGPDEVCGDLCEPPLTPEEEEEAPEDGDGDGRTCVCSHRRIIHMGQPDGLACEEDDCDCVAFRTKPDFELPPQPERRPPYAVAYSVQGHLFEVALPGDATVKAVDGALVIQHHLGPVAGIVQVLPVIDKESA